ncbi:Acyl-CoA synthetase (NDP forming) [Variovorax sp. HW608]|uniref:acetate--CoA ligase family protein n=1 Tax=Variovorax sp. HW608 TaxID=1034889 RepID=UPI00081FE628|nr:acetate--CoA ligase family protein [Variovorax sp. HW608]SCK29170.1 Acyl-CoA synthetase (NDP forming) [Variovorax sp. HW608]
MHSLHPLFHPASVALVGASSDPERIGGRPLRFMREGGFEAPIYPVNKSGDAIQGLPSFRSVSEIPHPVDQAVICVPVQGVEAAVQDSIAKGVRAIQIMTAGFAEIDAKGRALQARIAAMCREAGVRLLGPNSLGLLNVPTRFFSTFSTALNGLKPQPGPIALATQSGAFGSATYGMASLRGLGFSKIVATGNEADVDVAECIDYLADDPDTRIICAALESCQDGERLRRALRKAARAGKPVLIMKVGRTEAGAAAASTHTGSLAGNDVVYDTVFAECGAWRPQSIEEMLDIAYAFSVRPALPVNADIGIVTGSGGIGVLMADEAGDRGLALPALPGPGREAALALLPFAVASNPLDMTAQVTSVPQGVSRSVATMLDHTSWGTVFAYLAHVGLSPARFAATQAELVAVAQKHPGRTLVLVMLSTPEVNRALEAEGIVVFEDPSRAVRAVAALAALAQRREMLALPPQAPAAAGATLDLAGIDTEDGAKRVLAAAGLPVLPEQLCTWAAESAEAAQRMGFPVVAKIVSPDITHKTEVGGVILDLQDAEAVRAAHEELIARARRARPLARLEGVLIAPMLRGGVEVILGVHRDPTFGPMVMYGSGGTAVELFKDVAFASAPLSTERARGLLDHVRSTQLLRGWRGAPPCDEAALVAALCRLSEFAAAHAELIESVEINPFVVRQEGAACLDAVITLRAADEAETGRSSHGH